MERPEGGGEVEGKAERRPRVPGMSLTPEHVDCHSFTDMPTACPSGLTGTRTGWTHPPTVPHSAQFPWESMRGSASSITSPCLLIDHVVMGTDGQVQPIYKDSHSEREGPGMSLGSGVGVAPTWAVPDH